MAPYRSTHKQPYVSRSYLGAYARFGQPRQSKIGLTLSTMGLYFRDELHTDLFSQWSRKETGFLSDAVRRHGPGRVYDWRVRGCCACDAAPQSDDPGCVRSGQHTAGRRVVSASPASSVAPQPFVPANTVGPNGVKAAPPLPRLPCWHWQRRVAGAIKAVEQQPCAP